MLFAQPAISIVVLFFAARAGGPTARHAAMGHRANDAYMNDWESAYADVHGGAPPGATLRFPHILSAGHRLFLQQQLQPALSTTQHQHKLNVIQPCTVGAPLAAVAAQSLGQLEQWMPRH